MCADVKERRRENFDLLRWVHGGNNRLAAILRDTPIRNYVSDIARGKRSCSKTCARSVETKLDYADGWLDRDNVSMLKLSRENFETLSLVLRASPDEKAAIRTLLARYRQASDVTQGRTPQLRIVKS